MNETNTPREFSLLLDGRLSPHEEQAWRERLAADASLAESYRVFKSGVEVTSAARGLAELPPGFDARLRMRLKTDELHHRARRRAESEASRSGNWWQRFAIGVSGMAAGVALMLAIDPAGLWLQPEAAPVIAASSNVDASVVVGVLPDGARLSPSEVRQLAARKAELVGEFERSIQMAGRLVEPNCIERDLNLFMGDPSRGLLANARFQSREVGPETVDFLEALDTTCMQLQGMVEQARAERNPIASERVLKLLSTLRKDGQFALYSDCNMPQSLAEMGEEGRAARVQALYEAIQYASAAESAMRFISAYPASRRLGTVTRMGVMSLHRLGDSATALRLLDEVSLASPEVLRGFTMLEIDTLRNAALAPRSAMYDLTQAADGSFTLRQSQAGAAASRDRNIIANLADRLKTLIADLSPAGDQAANLVQRKRAIEESDQSWRGSHPGIPAAKQAKSIAPMAGPVLPVPDGRD